MNNKELKLSYQRFNVDYFHGVLPDMPVSFRRSLYGKGAFECCLKETRLPYAAEMIDGTGAIEINEAHKSEWKEILLHEMVHAYMAVIGLGRERHGRFFHEKCRKIEEASGIAVPRNMK